MDPVGKADASGRPARSIFMVWSHLSEAGQGHLAMFMFAMLVAGSFSLGALVANDITPLALTAARFVLTGVLVGAVAACFGQLKVEYARAPWRYVMLGGSFAGYFVLMFYGLRTASPVSTAAIYTLTPVMAAGFGWVLLGQTTTLRMGLALAIGALGAVVVIFRADVDALLTFKLGQGEVIYFIGCVMHAFYTPLVRKLNRGEPAVAFTFGTLVAGAAVMCVIGARDLGQTDWSSLPQIVWLGLAYLVVFASACTFVMIQFASLRLPSAKVMAYTYLVPTFVILWEIGLGQGVPPMAILIGIVLTIIALLMLLRAQ